MLQIISRDCFLLSFFIELQKNKLSPRCNSHFKFTINDILFQMLISGIKETKKKSLSWHLKTSLQYNYAAVLKQQKKRNNQNDQVGIKWRIKVRCWTTMWSVLTNKGSETNFGASIRWKHLVNEIFCHFWWFFGLLWCFDMKLLSTKTILHDSFIIHEIWIIRSNIKSARMWFWCRFCVIKILKELFPIKSASCNKIP